MPPKWSSGRACGAASTTQRPRSASLRSRALTDKTAKNKDAQKEPNDLQELCVFSANATLKMRKSGQRNDAGTVPLEARGVQRLKKQARTAPERRRKDAKKEPWPQRIPKSVSKRNPNSLKRNTLEIIVPKV